MKSFRLSITRDGKLSIACPECGSTKVEVTNYPVNEVDKNKVPPLRSHSLQTIPST